MTDPTYDAYHISYPPGQRGSQNSSQRPSSIGQYPPTRQSSSSVGTSSIYYQGYGDGLMATYVPTSATQQALYPSLNQTMPLTQSSHQSHSHSYSHSQPYPQQHAPANWRPQPHLSSHSRSCSQVQGYSPTQTSSQAPITHQQEQYLPHVPFAQTVTVSPQYPASPSRPFACDMCALSFSRAHDLRRHRETHTGEKPFPCNGGCGKTFSRKDAMRRHQLVKQCGTIEEAWP